MPTDLLLPLELLGSGSWAEVQDISGEPAWVARLEALGLRAGCLVQMLRGGSPCLCAVGEARFSLRPEAGLLVLVRPVPGPPPRADHAVPQ